MRLLAAMAIVLAMGGCSLLLDTGDLSGRPDSLALDGSVQPKDDATSPAGIDGGLDSGVEAGAIAIPAGLIGAWLFDDGTAKDSSGAGHDGTIEGNATIAMSDRGNALKLAASGAMAVTSLFDEAFPATEGTISLWFKYSSMTEALEHGVFDQWSDQRAHVFLRHPNGSRPGAMQVAFQEGDFYEWVDGFEVAKDTWAHVVISWDDGENRGRLFVNGVSVSDGSFQGSAFLPTNQWVRFGVNLDGFIDDIRLFERALTDDEIRALP